MDKLERALEKVNTINSQAGQNPNHTMMMRKSEINGVQKLFPAVQVFGAEIVTSQVAFTLTRVLIPAKVKVGNRLRGFLKRFWYWYYAKRPLQRTEEGLAYLVMVRPPTMRMWRIRPNLTQRLDSWFDVLTRGPEA